MNILKVIFIPTLLLSFSLKTMELTPIKNNSNVKITEEQLSSLIREITYKNFFRFGPKWLPKKYQADVDLGNINYNPASQEYTLRLPIRMELKVRENNYTSKKIHYSIVQSFIAHNYQLQCCSHTGWKIVIVTHSEIYKDTQYKQAMPINNELVKKITERINNDAVKFFDN